MPEPRTLNPAGADITQAIIKSYNGSKQEDLAGRITKWEITQSMDSVSYNGVLTVFDTTGLLENFPLRAEESLDLEIVGFDLDTQLELKCRIYKIDNIIPSESNNGTYFKVHFVSDTTFKASIRKIIRSYQSSMSGIAKEVFDTYFTRIGNADYLDPDQRSRTLSYATARHTLLDNDKRNVFIQPAGNIGKIVIPRMTPSEAMVFLAGRSYSGDTKSQTFRFFETLENYYYCTDEFFIQEAKAKNSILTFFYGPAASADPTDPDAQINRIEELRIISRGIDAATDIYSGAYRNKVVQIDLVRGTVDHYNFNYDTDARYIDMSGNIRSLETNPHTPEFRRFAFTAENAKTFIAFKDYSGAGDIPSSLHTDRYANEIISNRVSYFHHLNSTLLSGSTKGRLDLRPGMIINLDIKTLSAMDNDSGQLAETLAGKYMIKSTVHSRGEDNTLTTSFVLMKFDWSGGPQDG